MNDMDKNILYAWGLNATGLELPPGVGFKVGGDSGINYLYIQVHYELSEGGSVSTDDSGVLIRTVSGQDSGITKGAGILRLMSSGYVPEGISRHIVDCEILENKVIHPFRMRTHTHELGINMGLFMSPASDPTELVLIGEHDPQQPQVFYPIDDETLTIRREDKLISFCDYYNYRGKTVSIGSSHHDEMCILYLMYWVEGLNLHEERTCLEYNPRELLEE